eukprot:6207437-Alexandrium_andersonii.AAC.1
MPARPPQPPTLPFPKNVDTSTMPPTSPTKNMDSDTCAVASKTSRAQAHSRAATSDRTREPERSHDQA